MYNSQGRFSDAESLFAANLEIFTRLYGEAHPKTSNARNNMAAMYGSWGKIERQDQLFRENLEINRKAFGDDHPQTLFYMNNMVSSDRDQGRYKEAEALALESVKRHERVLGQDNPQTLTSMLQLFYTYEALKRFDEADSVGKVRVRRSRRLFGDRNPQTLGAMGAMADLYQGRGRNQEALPLRQEILAGLKAAYGEEHESVIGAYYQLAWTEQSLGDPKTALELRKKALELSRKLADRADAGPQDKMRYADGLVGAQRELQNPPEAIRYAERACEMTHHGNRDYLTTLAEAYIRGGRTKDAIRAQEAALALVTEDDPRPRDWMQPRLADFYEKAGNLEPKRRLRAAEIARKKEVSEKSGASPRARAEYARVLLDADPTDLRNPKEALRVSLALNEETHFQQSDMVQLLARAYYMAGEKDKAIQTQEKVLTMVPKDEIWNRETQEIRLRVYRGEGTSDVNPAQAFEGTWSGTTGPLKTRIRFERAGEFVNAVNVIELPWIPAGEIWFRFHAQTRAAEIQVADDGWTNLRWQAAEFRYIEPGELIVWHFQQMQPALFKRNPAP